MKFTINSPIWATRSVGIKRSSIREDIEVEISYSDRHGNKVFPHRYIMEKKRALAYPSKSFGNTPKLQIIPISAFEIKEPEVLSEDEKDRREYMKSMGLLN